MLQVKLTDRLAVQVIKFSALKLSSISLNEEYFLFCLKQKYTIKILYK